MAQYIWINPDRLENASTKESVDGIDLIVELSPYDVPRAIVGNYDQTKGRFLISFKYIDEEPEKTEPLHDDIEVVTGKYSGKLLKISIPIDRSPLDKAAIILLRTKVLDTLDAIKQKRERGYMNRQVTRQLVKDRFEALTEDLVGAN